MGPALGQVLLAAAGQALRREATRRIGVAFRRRAYFKMAETLSKKAVELDRAMRLVERESAGEALKIARELSSGRFSAAQLALLSHPYRIGGHPPQDPAIINWQTGEFYRGWRVIGPRAAGGTLTTKLVNESPQARALERGTSRMIARPILIRIQERVQARRRTLYRAAIRRTLSR